MRKMVSIMKRSKNWTFLKNNLKVSILDTFIMKYTQGKSQKCQIFFVFNMSIINDLFEYKNLLTA